MIGKQVMLRIKLLATLVSNFLALSNYFHLCNIVNHSLWTNGDYLFYSDLCCPWIICFSLTFSCLHLLSSSSISLRNDASILFSIPSLHDMFCFCFQSVTLQIVCLWANVNFCRMPCSCGYFQKYYSRGSHRSSNSRIMPHSSCPMESVANVGTESNVPVSKQVEMVEQELFGAQDTTAKDQRRILQYLIQNPIFISCSNWSGISRTRAARQLVWRGDCRKLLKRQL